MDATTLRWVLAVIGVIVIAGVYFFSVYQSRIRRQGAVKTFTQDELDGGLIEDENLRDELSSINLLLDQQGVDNDFHDIKINPALDANLSQSRASKPAIHLPIVMQQVADENLIAHVLKHADDRVLTSEELINAFTHIGLQVDGEGFIRVDEPPGVRFMFANMTESGSFEGLYDSQFFTYGIVCFFDLSGFAQPRICYEMMLKKVDELVRMLDLKVYNENLQLLTLQHVTETRQRLKAASDDG